MPEIPDLLDEQGEIDLLAPAVVFAFMAHPNDPQAVERFVWRFAGYVAAEVVMESHMKTVSRELFEVARQGATLDNLVQDFREPILRKRGQGAGALVAGRILLKVLQLAKHWPGSASLNKAVELLERESLASTTALKQSWGRWRSVSHLWAAVFEWLTLRDRFSTGTVIVAADEAGVELSDQALDEALKEVSRQLGLEHFSEELGEEITFLEPECLLAFLSMAESLRRAGEKHIYAGPGANGRPLLDCSEMLTFPAKAAPLEFELDPPPLTADEESFLKR